MSSNVPYSKLQKDFNAEGIQNYQSYYTILSPRLGWIDDMYIQVKAYDADKIQIFAQS